VCVCVCTPAGAAPGSSTVINDEPSLFDFIVKAAVSEYGGVQRVLLAPSTADSRAILLAVTQLLLYEQWQRRQRQQQQVSTAAGERGRRQLSYRQLKTLCHQVRVVCASLCCSVLSMVLSAYPEGGMSPVTKTTWVSGFWAVQLRLGEDFIARGCQQCAHPLTLHVTYTRAH